MSAYPTSTSGLAYVTYPVGPTAATTSITGSGSTNTKAAYVELAASTSIASTEIQIAITTETSGSNWGILMDIATGAAGAESVLLADLSWQYTIGASGLSQNNVWSVPVTIASGTRIAARIQQSVASKNVSVAITLSTNNGRPALASLATVGSDTTTSKGASVDPGGSANTKGSYTQISASTAAITQWLMLMFSWVDTSGVGSPTVWAIDIATGAGGAEVVLIPDIRTGLGSNNPFGPGTYMFLTYIAASTRIASRASSNFATATGRHVGVAILLGTAPSETTANTTAYAFS